MNKEKCKEFIDNAVNLNEEQLLEKINEIKGRLGLLSLCNHCGGSGFDSYPNHSTTYPICTVCEGTGIKPQNFQP